MKEEFEFFAPSCTVEGDEQDESILVGDISSLLSFPLPLSISADEAPELNGFFLGLIENWNFANGKRTETTSSLLVTKTFLDNVTGRQHGPWALVQSNHVGRSFQWH